MSKRRIIKIDESKCDGCGLCIPNCPEGALQIIDGKARLVNDLSCDGLGACIGKCPNRAITFEDMEPSVHGASHKNDSFAGCPGSRAMDLGAGAAGPREKPGAGHISRLRQWPIQLSLVPVSAPYFNGADILIASDCVGFAYPDLQEGLLSGKILLIGCPKLDDMDSYKTKLISIFRSNDIRSVTYAHMEVPCCLGFIGPIKQAIADSGRDIAFEDITIGIKGEMVK